jgi:hypothetical protein
VTEETENVRLMVEIEKRWRDFAKQYAVSRGLTLSELVTDLLRQVAERERAGQGPAAWAAPDPGSGPKSP